MNENKVLNFDNAATIIKEAIVRSRYQAAKLVNKELLGLYYAVGKYVSDNSRVGTWGKGAIRRLSDALKKELPGLRGFSESSIKLMRTFYEEWQSVFSNRQSVTGDLKKQQGNENRPLAMDDLRRQQNHQLMIDDRTKWGRFFCPVPILSVFCPERFMYSSQKRAILDLVF